VVYFGFRLAGFWRHQFRRECSFTSFVSLLNRWVLVLVLVLVSHQCLRFAQLVICHGLGGLCGGLWYIGSWQIAVVRGR
jgi:hypothetical protein